MRFLTFYKLIFRRKLKRKNDYDDIDFDSDGENVPSDSHKVPKKEEAKELYNDFKQNLSKTVDSVDKEKILENLVDSINSFEKVKISNIKDKTTKNENSAMEKESQIQIKLCLGYQRCMLEHVPQTFDDLQKLVLENIRSSQRKKSHLERYSVVLF